MQRTAPPGSGDRWISTRNAYLAGCGSRSYLWPSSVLHMATDPVGLAIGVPPGRLPAEGWDTTPACRAIRHAAERSLLGSSLAGGLSLAVADHDGVIWAATLGFADIGARREVTAGTLFEIGSISKGFTAALLLQAQETGLVDIDKPLKEYLPWFEVKSRFRPISLRDLMTHTAGIVSGTDFSGESAFEVWSLRETEATVEPGTWFHYSNVGYKALGLVLASVHRQAFHDVLRDRLLRALGMAESESSITHDTRHRLAVGYEPFYDDRAPRREHGLVPATWVETSSADGSIAATARDMAAWLRFLITGGLGESGVRLLGTSSMEEMLSPLVESDETGFSYGLGVYISHVDGHRYASHGGGMIGYHGHVACDLEEGLGAIVLANGDGPWQELAFHAVAVLRAERTGSPEPAFTVRSSVQADPVTDDEPDHWALPFVGHYRTYNPWCSNLRVYWRGGQLWASYAMDDVGHDAPLVRLSDGYYRLGSEERCPERLRFDTVIDGKAVRVTLSGCALYRTFTP